MSVAKDLTELGKLIARQHGWPAAKAFKAYEMNDRDRAVLTTSAVDLLTIFLDVPAACAAMSAAFAVQLERVLRGPIQVVAGTLTVEGEAVFGDRSPRGGAASCSTEAYDCNGHVWVMVGPYVADISIFRIAYSPHGPPKLARHINLVFGPNQGLYVEHWRRTRRRGLGYEPHYVLSAAEVTALMGGAYQTIEAHRTSSAAA
ncbi:hypothetical protein [Sphingomonas natans]|nr:hypothetical protein [Sphingomonas sp. BIUV-7]